MWFFTETHMALGKKCFLNVFFLFTITSSDAWNGIQKRFSRYFANDRKTKVQSYESLLNT